MATSVKRSDERLVFYFKTQDTPTTVKRKTLKRAATNLGLDETGFLHLAAAQLIERLERGPKVTAAQQPVEDDGRLTDAQIAAIRSMEPQDATPTRSFLDLLNK